MSSKPLNKAEIRKTKLSREEFVKVQRNPIYIVLDSLKSAHNIATILRLADAVLAEKVFICGNTVSLPNKKIIKFAKGTEKWVDWEYHKSSVDVISSLKEKGVSIVALEIANQSIEYSELKTEFPVCLILGREDHGVSNKALELSDHIVHLPILGMGNSINVSTAASVVMYEFIKQLT
ncbi:MAG: hypothetical protein HQK84_07020 [Nitrospinae bacterium]|nr:hypothetical protein [Nitrospinota bacterium]